MKFGFSEIREIFESREAPEIKALIGCEQDTEQHPEGDVFQHTLYCLDVFAKRRIGNQEDDLVVGLAVLCHDFGKPATTKLENGKIRAIGHEQAGEEPTRNFLEGIDAPPKVIEQVVPLVTEHLKPLQLFESQASDKAIRKLAERVNGRIDLLARVTQIDLEGRPPLEFSSEATDWLVARWKKIQAAEAKKKSKPKPIISGKDLIGLGIKPGPEFGKILKACAEAQARGEFSTLGDGLEFVKKIMS